MDSVKGINMTYSLDFSNDFFVGSGEAEMNRYELRSERPTSVYQAIASMEGPDWENMCRCIFGADPAFVSIEAVMTMVRETNTCSNLKSPVRVWIDEEGLCTVRVYDKDEE